MMPLPPRSTLFPYTTLFRSALEDVVQRLGHVEGVAEGAVDGAVGAAGGRGVAAQVDVPGRSEEHTSELQSHVNLVCRLLLEKKKKSQKLANGWGITSRMD